MYDLVTARTVPDAPRLISRRRMLKGLAVAGAAGLAAGLKGPGAVASTQTIVRQAPGYNPWLWSDPRAWADGRVPGPDDHAILSSPLLVEGDVSVGAVTIESAGALVFSPHTATRLSSRGNVVVAGRLVMRPDDATVEHVLTFVDVNESAVVGGGHEPLASDVGLWVVDDGQLDLVGADKTAWTRLAGSAARGATIVDLQAAPTGWRVGDELVIMPTQPTNAGTAAWAGYSSAAISSMSGNRVGLSAATAYAHPVAGDRWNAEVINLSRNVRIEGTPTGRAHVMVTMARRPQTIRHVAIRHMGPKAGDVGRYGLHFHNGGDGTRGSIVEGVVVRDCGNHAFVPHGSHGIAFRNTVAYNVGSDAYWWDPAPSRFDYPQNASFDVIYDRCLAANVYPRGGLGEHTLTGFFLGHGQGNACLDCVAVGVQGKSTASGFHWPSSANLQPNVWRFERGVTHNNKVNGVFVWQNGAGNERHPVNGLVCYRNGKHGVEHGAYANAYEYGALACFDNAVAPVLSHANAQTIGQFWRTPDLDASGAAYSLRIAKHKTEPRAAVVFSDARLRGYLTKAVLVGETNSKMHGRYDFVRCVAGDRDLAATDFKVVKMHPNSVYRVQRRDGTAFQLRPDGTAAAIPAFA